jgi:hypothetical protein
MAESPFIRFFYFDFRQYVILLILGQNWNLMNITPNRIINVNEFDADPTGKRPSTTAIQSAIDSLSDLGGGIIRFSPGDFICGTVELRDNISVEIQHGVTIHINRDEDDIFDVEELPYLSCADTETTYFRWSLFYAKNCDNISISGTGIIDGNGYPRGGPKPIAFVSCSNVEIRGITIRKAPNYAISLLDCEYVLIDGVKIQEALADGIDPDNCRNVVIGNCLIESADDAIVPKTSPVLGKRSFCANITVTNCLLATACNCFKLGTESYGDFRNITVSNCVFNPLGYSRPPVGGIALESVDGSNIQGVAISNITMNNVDCPIFLRLGNRARAQTPPPVGTLEYVTISNVVARNARTACIISGIPEHPIRHVSIDHVMIQYGHADAEEIAARSLQFTIPEEEKKYPDPRMFGPLSAAGWFIRHAGDISISSQNFHWTIADPRAIIVCDDVMDLTIRDCKFHSEQNIPGQREPFLLLRKILAGNLIQNRFISSEKPPQSIIELDCAPLHLKDNEM